MWKVDFLLPQRISNWIKEKRLQKFRWYCQMCQEQCQDENGFKCHCLSESHQCQLLLASKNPEQSVDHFSDEFQNDFLELLRRRFRTKRVHCDIIYKEYIGSEEHLPINCTRWETLTDFAKWLGREGLCKVDKTPKGWYMQCIDGDPEVVCSQEVLKGKKKEVVDAEQSGEFIEERVRECKEEEKVPLLTELERENEEENVGSIFGWCFWMCELC